MPSGEKDKNSIKDSLLRKGVPAEEIQKVYRTLRDKGYGEEEARRRSRAALDRLKVLAELEERRRSGQASGRTAETAGRTGTTSAAAGAEPGRRAVDWLPEVPGWLRRRINKYAFRNGFVITRLSERFDDFLSLFDAKRPDFVSRELLALLADERGFRGENPYRLSFIDNLNLLRESACRLLGTRTPRAVAVAEGEVLKELRAREPFAVDFFSTFTQPQDMLRKCLEHLGTRLRARESVRVSDLARVVKDGCRFIAITDAIERDKLEALFDIVREVNLTLVPGNRAGAELVEAEGLFRAGFQNLARYSHELYPAMLKMIAAFYTEEDQSTEKAQAIRELLGIQDGDLLTWEGWQQRVSEQREREIQERQARELARLEEEKAAKFSVRFEGTFSMLSSLFPGSSVERIEQGEFILPYFANRIFARTPVFQAHAVDMESMSSSDIMGVVLVIHSLLDDLLSAATPSAMERVVGREGFQEELVSLREDWRNAYPRIFEPYLEAVHEYARETGGDERYAKLFKDSQRARAIAEKINQLRNNSIRSFGHVGTERGQFEGPMLYELASRLAALLTEAGLIINQSALAAVDPVNRKLMADLAANGIVDYVASVRTGTSDYRPVARQIRRWVEARFRGSVLDVPDKSQVAFLDVFRGIAYLYEALLNDPKGPAAGIGHGVSVASSAEHAVWNRERAVGARDSQRSLQATLREQFPGQFLDALTGLKNKDYFLNELPRELTRIRTSRAPLTFLMIDIDHFKWVNDKLGHARGDEVLKATAGMVLDNIREDDLAIRYGGEEMLIVVPSDMHTGIVLAERLRFAQETRVLARDGMQDVLKVGQEGGQPCGTLSIGVADVGAIPDIQKAVEKVDRALYGAKRGRNAVVCVELVKGGRGTEVLTTYAEYHRRAVNAAG